MTTLDTLNPNWAPLEHALAPDNDLGGWMWMCAVTVNGQRIEQYKHRATRRYLNLDGEGQAWMLDFSDEQAPVAAPIPLSAGLAWALS